MSLDVYVSYPLFYKYKRDDNKMSSRFLFEVFHSVFWILNLNYFLTTITITLITSFCLMFHDTMNLYGSFLNFDRKRNSNEL